MINIDALNDEEKLAALESIHKSIAESKEIQRKKITTNVEMIVKALKKIEADLKQRYDETGQLIANLKSGEDGRDGKDGKDGKNGKDGRDGPMGPRGYDGVPGRNGLDGTDGVSVTDAHIDFDGSLIISLSSGRVINVGEVVSADIAEKIKVITNGGGTSQSVLDAIASLQAQIDAIASGLEYQGTWNASTNVPTLASSVGTNGYYYVVSTAGSTNLNGITDWQIGDWAVFNGSVWQKIDQSNLVTSVAGRTGAIVLTTADIGGLGTIATQAANNVSITGGSITGITDLAIADGGTGASTANAAFNALAPSQTGNSGKYLTTDGTDTSWATNPLGTVTSVSGTGTVNGLTLTGTVTTSGSLTLGGTLSGIANSALTNSSITINGSATSLGGSINVGTVTSVAATVPSFLSIGGSPVTSSGTLAITLSGTALPTTSGGTGLTSFTANGVVYASSTSALATGSALTFDGSKLVNTGYNISAYQVSTGAVSTFESVGGGYLTYDGAGGASVYSRSNATTENALTFRASGFSFRIGGTQVASLSSSNFSLYNSQLLFNGATSGYTGFAAPAVSNFTVYTLPSSDGTNGQSLTTNGSGTLSWVSGTGGTVTSVGGTGTVSGLTLTGTVTSSGNLTLGGALDLSAYNGAGAFTTLSASSTVTLSGGTANGVAFLNGSKVVTSGSALVFDGTNLSVGGSNSQQRLNVVVPVFTTNASGGMRIGDSGNNYYVDQLVTTDGSANPFWDVKFATHTLSRYAYGGGNNFWAWYANNSEQMRLTSTGLGIGTSSPNGRLEVVGSTGASFNGWFRTGDATAANNAGGGFYNTSSATAASRKAVLALDADGANLGGGDYFTIEKSGNSGVADILQYSNAAIRFGTNFTNRATFDMTLDASGNLGLGVTPSAWDTNVYKALQVGTGLGSASVIGRTDGINGGGLTLNAYYSATGYKYIGSSFASLYLQNNGQHQFYTAASGTAGNAITFTQAMTLDASGNLSLGNTSGSYRLGITGTATSVLNIESTQSESYIRFQDTNTNSDANAPRIGTIGDGNFAIRTGGSERARIDSSGNVGIGTTSPAHLLDVTGVANITQLLIRNGGTPTVPGNTTPTFSSPSSGTLVLSNNGSESLRIDSSGHLLVATTNTGVGVGNTNSGFNVEPNGTTLISRDNNIALYVNTNGDRTLISCRRSGTEVGSISVTTTATAFNTSSDQRLKENIVDADSASSLIDSLKVRQFDWKSDSSHQRYGFVAQELVTIAPEAVYQPNDTDEMMAVDYSKLVPMLVKEIQSLRKRLADAGI